MVLETRLGVAFWVNTYRKTVFKIFDQVLAMIVSKIVAPSRNIKLGVSQADLGTFVVVCTLRIVKTRGVHTLVQGEKV